MTGHIISSTKHIAFAFYESGLTLQPQTTRTMLQTRYFFGYYYFYAAA